MRATAYLNTLFAIRRYNDPQPLKHLQRRLDLLYGDEAKRAWYLTANGRTALELILSSLPATPGDEVIVQAFTCVAAVNPILWAGLTPVFADIDPANLSLSLESVKAHITAETKAIIVQHSFGIPGHIEQIVELAHAHGIIVIEDCAHALGTPQVSQKLGTYGDAAILSFGIEKTLSTKFGGALLLNTPELALRVEPAFQALPLVKRRESFRWLLYPLIQVGLRRLPGALSARIGRLLTRAGLLRQAVAPIELEGGRPIGTPARLTGVHATVIEDALTTLDQNLTHRARISQIYAQAFADKAHLVLPAAGADALILYPLVCGTPELRDYLYQMLQARGVPISLWYDPPIYPRGANLAILGYDPLKYPVAEAIASRIICLPTGKNISPRYATVIANDLNAYSTDFAGPTTRVSSSS